MKYIVMECHPAFAVVLDEQGRFIKVANFHYQVGETVTDVMEMHSPDSHELNMWKKKPKRRWLMTLCMVAASVVILIGMLWQMNYATYGSVYLRINPEIRVDVNRWEKVLAVTGMNEDGKKLVKGFEPDGSLEDVLTQLVERAETEGYLKENGKVSLALDAKNYDWVVSHGEELRSELEHHVDDGVQIVLGPDWNAGELPVPQQLPEEDADQTDNHPSNDEDEDEDDEENEEDDDEEDDDDEVCDICGGNHDDDIHDDDDE